MKARLINAWRRLFPHPTATARRIESERAKAARTRIADRDRQRALLFAQGLKRERIARG